MLKDLLASLFHPSEVVSMVTVKVGKGVPGAKSNKAYTGDLQQLAHTLNDLDFCYAVLNKVSRSFAVVIQQLPYELKTAVCIFYLVLRGLDSVEDDMTYDVHSKIPLLRTFYQKLYESEWRIQDVGDTEDYRILLANFQKVIHEFLKLKPEYQEVIADVAKQMGEGMAEYAQKLDVKAATSSNGTPANTTYNVNTKAEYDKYCYYVAGLVGYGLCQLFGASGLEDKNLAKQQRLWNSMGMFLQKTNIIRDYLEDLHAARMWWPKEIWSQYAPTLQWYKDHPDSDQALQCLNHMIHDALALVPDVLEYLSHLRHQQIFEFCAIPQVMAIATLATIHNNVNVFKRMVKIRKGLTCRILLECKNRQQVGNWFNEFTEQMLSKVNPSTDVQSASTIKMLKSILQQTQDAATNDPELITLQHTTTNTLNGKSLYSPKSSSATANTTGFRSSSIAWILLVTCLFILYIKRASGDFAGTTLDSLLPSFTLKRDNSLEMAALLGGSFSFLYLVNSVLNRP